MNSRIAQLTRVRFPYSNFAEQQQARRLLITNLAWILVLLIVSPAPLWWIIHTPTVNPLAIALPLTLVLSLFSHRLIQRGQLGWGRGLFVLNVLMVTLLSIFPGYRLDTPYIVVMILPLTAAGVLLRRNGLFIVGVLLIVLLAAIGYVQYETNMEPNQPTSIGESIWVTLLVVTAVIAVSVVMLWTFVGSMESTYRQQQRLDSLIQVAVQISRTLVSLPDTDDGLNRALEQLRDTFGLYHVQVFLADPVTGLAILQASTGYVGRRLLEEESLLMPDEASPINDALRQTDPILIRETAPESRRSGFLPATRSECLLPLRVGNLLPLGVLDLHSTAPETFSARMLDTLALLSNHLAVVLHGIRQTNELHTAYQEREQLGEQVESTQREITRLNRQLVGDTWGGYLEERRDAILGFEWAEGELKPSADESEAMKQAFSDGKPRLEQQNDEYVMCVPIRLRGQTLGVVEFRRSGDVGWSSYALELAQAVAERLALSLENTRLFEQAQVTARREQLVSSVTAQLQVANDLQTLLSLAAAQFQDALGAIHTRVRLGLPSVETQ